ncbi:MAG: hypothetical protein IJ716_15725 [Lachnospiraceae bacterium]|nr:hypothetical protein [Lachnospiraceae bacterium]
MKKHKFILPVVVILLGVWLCGCGSQNHVYTETGLKNVAEKSLHKKYNEEFVVHNVWSKNQDVFYADCSPKDNSEIVFRADVYKNGKGVEADNYKQTILAGEINRILKPYFEDVFGRCYTRCKLGRSYSVELRIQEDQPIELQLKEYLHKYSDFIVCSVFVEMHDASPNDIDEEYVFLTSTLLEKIQSDICPDVVPDLKVNLWFVDEETLKKSEVYFQTNTSIMGEFDSELMKYGNIIGIYKDGKIDIDYEEYKKRRMRFQELRKENN